MSSSSDVKYLNSCMGVFTGFVHGSNPRKLDKEGQVEIVAPNPSLLELVSKSMPAADERALGCQWHTVRSTGDGGASFTSCSLVFSCLQWQYRDLRTF